MSSVSAHRVDLSEHCTLSEEQRLPGVHQDQIKVGLPGPVGGTGLWSIETHTHTQKQKVLHTNMNIKTRLLSTPAHSAQQI